MKLVKVIQTVSPLRWDRLRYIDHLKERGERGEVDVGSGEPSEEGAIRRTGCRRDPNLSIVGLAGVNRASILLEV